MTVDALGRAVDLYRRTATSRSAILLIVANLIPLVGVLVFGWSLWTLLVLYWVENGIVGFWNVPKLLLAHGGAAPAAAPAASAAAAPAVEPASESAAEPAAASAASPRVRVLGQAVGSRAGRVGLAAFFVVHYGGFWVGHGVFVFLLPTIFGDGDGGEVVWGNVVIAAIALFISHGASFLLNFIGRGEYLTATPMGQMGAPYSRVVVLHLTIIFGAFVVAALGAPIGALLILVVLKTAFDLGLHLRERRNAAFAIPLGPAQSPGAPDSPGAATPPAQGDKFQPEQP